MTKMSFRSISYTQLLPNRCPSKTRTLSGTYIFLCFILYWLYGGYLGPFLLGCFAVTKILYRIEDRCVYHPLSPDHSRIFVPTPSMFHLPFQDVYTRAKDGTVLHMYFITRPEEEMKIVPTILYLHGNAGNMGHRLQNVLELYNQIQCNILMLEYRGYGFSHGSPSEEGLYMDAQAGLEYLVARTDINSNEIIVFGRSLGGAVAIDLATRHENRLRIWCLIVENTFTSIPDMASIVFNTKIMRYLPTLFYKNKFLSLKKVPALTVPTMFISGSADNLVPPRMMSDLYNNCKSTCKRFIVIRDGTHNETWTVSTYYEQIQSFIKELRETPPTHESSCHFLMDDI